MKKILKFAGLFGCGVAGAFAMATGVLAEQAPEKPAVAPRQWSTRADGFASLKVEEQDGTTGGQVGQTDAAGQFTATLSGVLDNQGGRIAGNGTALTLSADRIESGAGQIIHAGATGGTLRLDATTLNGVNGTIAGTYGTLVLNTNGQTSPSYTENGAMIPAENNAMRLFTKLFVTDSPAEQKRQAELIREGRSVMDVVGAEARALQREVGPGDRDKLDADETLDVYADKLGAPASITRADEAVARLRAARALRADAAQALEVASTLAEGARTLSETEVGGGRNALQSVLGV